MRIKECVAMILAGGQGSRLGPLTKKLAKPAVPFGGKYRIIDFPLSNCRNSLIDTVGVLTQYQPLALHSYIGIGSAWDMDRRNGGVYVLPPYAKEKGGEWYQGTADAIYQNINFISLFEPECVLILSGDHIYKMDYAAMIEYHKSKNADITIAVIEVPWEEANRFGIMDTAKDGRIVQFEEKPKTPKSNLASMGVYVFNWPVLKTYLEEDGADPNSSHDFGKDIIPKMLADKRGLFAYKFDGYWRDVGTVESYWEASMDLVANESPFNLHDPKWKIYSVNPTQPPQYVACGAKITCSLVSEGSRIFGEVENSVIFPGVYIGPDAVVKQSVIMPYAAIGSEAVIEKAIIGRKTIIENGVRVGGADDTKKSASASWFSGITLISDNAVIKSDTKIKRNIVLNRTADGATIAPFGS